MYKTSNRKLEGDKNNEEKNGTSFTAVLLITEVTSVVILRTKWLRGCLERLCRGI